VHLLFPARCPRSTSSSSLQRQAWSKNVKKKEKESTIEKIATTEVPKIEKNKRDTEQKMVKIIKKKWPPTTKVPTTEVPTNRSDKTINGQHFKKMAIYANNKNANNRSNNKKK